MADDTRHATRGLETEPAGRPDEGRKVTGDPAAPPAAATETLNDLQMREAQARAAQAEQADEPDNAQVSARGA